MNTETLHRIKAKRLLLANLVRLYIPFTFRPILLYLLLAQAWFAHGAVTFELVRSNAGAAPYVGVIQGRDGRLYAARHPSDGHDTLFSLNLDGSGYTDFYVLDRPVMAIMQGADGALYGSAPEFATFGDGILFKVNPDGTGYSVLATFPSPQGSSVYSAAIGSPYAAVIQASDGMFYGAGYGEDFNCGYYGSLFAVSPNGGGLNVLKNFNCGTYTVARGSLVQGQDSALYGTTLGGGINFSGTVFKLNRDGTGYTVLKNFDSPETGGYLNSGLAQGSNGALYGVASFGGLNDHGTIYKLNPDGSGFTVLLHFDGPTTGKYAYAGLVLGPDNVLYGTTVSGGANNLGTIFKMNTDGTGFAVLYHHDIATGGFSGNTGMLLASDGNLYGVGGGPAGSIFRLVFDPPIQNLPAGSNIKVEPFFESSGTPPVLDLTFDSVTSGGVATVTAITDGPPPPDGFKLTGQNIVYDISTTATFSGSVQVCFGYDDSQVGDETSLALFHYENEAWVNITTSLDTINNTICGSATSFSPFAIFQTSPALFADDAIVWCQPLARNGASEDTDPGAANTLKYGFKKGSTIPVKIHLRGRTSDVTANSNVEGQVQVLQAIGCDNVAEGNAVPIEYNGNGQLGGKMEKIGGHLVFNLDTKLLPTTSQCFLLKVTVTDTTTGESQSETVPLQSK